MKHLIIISLIVIASCYALSAYNEKHAPLDKLRVSYQETTYNAED